MSSTFLEKKNGAKSLIENDPLASDAIQATITTGENIKFPQTGLFRVTIWDLNTYSDPNDDPNMEELEREPQK